MRDEARFTVPHITNNITDVVDIAVRYWMDYPAFEPRWKRTQVKAGFSWLIHIGPVAHAVSCTKGTAPLSRGGGSGRRVSLTPHTLLVTGSIRLWIRLFLKLPFSWHVTGHSLPLRYLRRWIMDMHGYITGQYDVASTFWTRNMDILS
jgi:hypothetical protein